MADPVIPQEIPGDEPLYNRIHHTQLNFETGKPHSSAFDKVRQSVNWSRFATAHATAARHANPHLIAVVVSLMPEACRQLQQTVEHTPMMDAFGFNPAHAEICGQKTNSIRTRLRDASKVAWKNVEAFPHLANAS